MDVISSIDVTDCSLCIAQRLSTVDVDLFSDIRMYFLSYFR